MDDYYELLQISPTAEHHSIEAAYRRLSVQAAGDAERKARLDEAYAVLIDPARRRRYDRERVAARASRSRSAAPGRKQGSGIFNKRLAFTAIGAIVALVAVGGVLALSLGGDDDNGADATPTSSGAFGPPPVLGDSVLAVSPTHGQVVRQEDTLSPDPEQPQRGVCAQVTFLAVEGVTLQWFHILFDDELVTLESTWLIDDPEDPPGGTLCYAPTEGFEVGVHQVQVLVQDPAGGSARQVVRWAFEVTP